MLRPHDTGFAILNAGIFLNTTSINFTFVNDFIRRRVTDELSPEQKGMFHGATYLVQYEPS